MKHIIPGFGIDQCIVLLFQLGGHKWDPKHMDLFLRYICWNKFCKLLQSRVTGLCLALAVWLRSGGRGPHTRGRVSSYPQLVGDSSRMQHVAFLQSFLCPNQNVNYICLSVAVSTGERPSLFGVGACRKSVTTLSIITPPSRHTPDLYVLLGAPGVRIAITPTFYRARCTLSINLTTQWVKQFTKCNRGSLLLHAHKYLHEGFRRQALDSMSAVSNRICFYKSVFANLRFEVYSLLQNQHWFELISSGLVCSLRHSLPQSPIILVW